MSYNLYAGDEDPYGSGYGYEMDECEIDELTDDYGDYVELSKEPENIIDLYDAIEQEEEDFETSAYTPDVSELEEEVNVCIQSDSSEETDDENEILEEDPDKLSTLEGKSSFADLKDWNKEFQEILAQPDSREKYRTLQELGHDFVYAAKTYGKIIISEIELPEDAKTIKSIDAGGIAGGEKYICQSIFFKFVTDNNLADSDKKPMWMYGGEERNDVAAIKAAGLELQGLISFYNAADYESIHFPLMALIDYHGYRLIALSILPVEKKTIIYGSADAGRTVHAKSEEFNRIMLNLGKQLNLCPHNVGGKIMAACGDIEGHLGKDGKYYLLDFARTFPPEAPPKPYVCFLSRL